MTANIQVRQVNILSDSQMEAVVETIDEAFNRDFFSSALGNRALVRPLIKAHFTAAIKGGSFFVGSLNDEDFVGVALWFGPGKAFLSREEDRVEWDDVMNQLTPELRSWWNEYFMPAYHKFTDSSLGVGSKLGAWHLQLLGVTPTHQRKGVMKALVAAVQDR